MISNSNPKSKIADEPVYHLKLSALSLIVQQNLWTQRTKNATLSLKDALFNFLGGKKVY